MHRSCPERRRAARSTKRAAGKAIHCVPRAKERSTKRPEPLVLLYCSRPDGGRALRHQRCSRVINGWMGKCCVMPCVASQR
ncbi:hypothetical protein NPIL_421851 [Nephila pilipes]|uniref:Uncharacterized protein n=1 Tax=Nephila pilipes TaxID=299642 RepID=A0A8X6IG63_NEPPI|nr:hypothetical protein NPIL_421851 [Nephila pilipes]